MRKICIIPARGGSKRIPNKNIKNFLGKPIIAYTIESALKTNLFDIVMVSTDNKEIAEIAKQYGAEIPFFRSDINSNDYATTTDVILEVLNEYQKLGIEFKFACCCYPTAPFITAKKLEEGYEKLIKNKATSVLPIVEYDYPIWRSLKKDEFDKIEMYFPDKLNSRSQDLAPAYHDAGQWYWMNVNEFLKKRQIFNQNSIGVILEPIEVQDIDNESDWKIAELKFIKINS